jgi:hypothetical protein
VLLWPRELKTVGGVALGSLPGGVTRERLNLVIVTLDTTRADRIGAYGARDVETPAFDSLAREGVLFEQAVAVAPLTLPVHSSIFTGKFPPEHGVRDNGGFFLGPEQVTLAEVLKDRGYRTGAFVAAYVLDSKWGTDQGFDTYFDGFDLPTGRLVPEFSAGQRGGQGPALDHETRTRPSHLIHSAPHTPYRPPEPFDRYQGHRTGGGVADNGSGVLPVPIAGWPADGGHDGRMASTGDREARRLLHLAWRRAACHGRARRRAHRRGVTTVRGGPHAHGAGPARRAVAQAVPARVVARPARASWPLTHSSMPRCTTRVGDLRPPGEAMPRSTAAPELYDISDPKEAANSSARGDCRR